MSVLVRIATRKSPLALAQTRNVGAMLKTHHPDLEIVEVPLSTEGDEKLAEPLAKSGGKGLFVTEVEAALLDGRADLAVHSMKDVPNDLAPGMSILCMPKREDPRDVFVSRGEQDFMELSAGQRLGTSSLRRACQVYGQRRDLAFHVLRGNVGTRLSKLESGAYHGIVLAQAGLLRLDLHGELRARGMVATPISIETMLPAVGQAALAIEGATQNGWLKSLLAPLEHYETRVAVATERAFLRALQGNCTTPIAAHARFEEHNFVLEGAVFALDGSHLVRSARTRTCTNPQHLSLDAAAALGTQLAEDVINGGAADLLEMSRKAEDPYAWLYSR